MNYHNITHDDLKNGDGVRVVLWVSGCSHHCKECQNPQTWDCESGVEFDEDALRELQNEVSKDYIAGITFSGGDPLYESNRNTVSFLCRTIKRLFPKKTIWVYTGYTYEQLLEMNNIYINGILWDCDVLVDGEYVKELRDTQLKWRGSSNQRVIDMKRTRESGKVVLWCD